MTIDGIEDGEIVMECSPTKGIEFVASPSRVALASEPSDDLPGNVSEEIGRVIT